MTDPFYLTPIYSNGTITIQVWATSGDNAEAADLSITYSNTVSTYTGFTGPSGWLAVANPVGSTVLASETGVSPVGTTADGLIGTFSFTPTAGVTDFSVSGSVSDWTDATGNEYPAVSLGSADVPICFVRGTLIATRVGDVPVETLRVGDCLTTAADGRTESVVWIGHRHIDCCRHPEPEQVWPVLVAAGAFGPGLPYRDLWLSPNHAVLVGDVLIPIKCLINDITIEQVPVDNVEYYHIELPQHDVILAQGMPAESYLDVGDRSDFSNEGGALRLFPDFSNPSQGPATLWEAKGYAPLIVCGPELEAARAIVNAQAAAISSIRLSARL